MPILLLTLTFYALVNHGIKQGNSGYASIQIVVNTKHLLTFINICDPIDNILTQIPISMLIVTFYALVYKVLQKGTPGYTSTEMVVHTM